MVIFSVLECVPVSSGAAPDLGLATSVSWVSSSVSGDTSHFGPDVVGAGHEAIVPASVAEGNTAPSCTRCGAHCPYSGTQCKSCSYTFVAKFGVPCDCSQRSTASGQCEEASHTSCAGTPCCYSAPPRNVVGQFDFCSRASGLQALCQLRFFLRQLPQL